MDQYSTALRAEFLARQRTYTDASPAATEPVKCCHGY